MTSDLLRAAQVQLAGDLAARREEFIRAALAERLPPRLHWTMGHPRVLRVLLWLRPRWRFEVVTSLPEFEYRDGKIVATETLRIR